MPLMQSVAVKLAEIYVPARFRSALDPQKLQTLTASIGETGVKVPIHVRRDKDKERYVLVSGFHRLEAVRALGQDTIQALIVQTPLR
jgi:sulfiredoxin